MFYRTMEETEQLLITENFVDPYTQYEVLKSEIDDLLASIKKIIKLKYVINDPDILKSIVRYLAQARNEVANASGCFLMECANG